MDAVSSGAGPIQVVWESPRAGGLSTVPSSELPGWTCNSQLEAAMLGDRPSPLLLLPHRAGLPTIPIGKTAGSWASTGWEKFLVGWGPPCSSPALSSTVVAINNQGYG